LLQTTGQQKRLGSLDHVKIFLKSFISGLDAEKKTSEDNSILPKYLKPQ